MDAKANDGALLHVKQAAVVLGVAPVTVRRAIHSGSLQAVRLGPNGRYRVSTRALEAFLVPATREGQR